MFELLDQSALTSWLNSLLWGFPGAEIFHILMTGGFFGSLLLLDLRLLGVHKFLSASGLLKHAIGAMWCLFTGVVLSGLLLFMFMPLEYSSNPVFLIKMVLILVGGLNALLMHYVLLRNQKNWDKNGSPPVLVRLSALISLLIWSACLACGRLIAYYYGYGY